MGLFTWLFGCKNADNKQDLTSDNKTVILKEITSRFDADEGWHDVFFSIVSSTSTDSTRTYIYSTRNNARTTRKKLQDTKEK